MIKSLITNTNLPVKFNNIMTIDVEDWYHSLDENSENWGKYEDRILSNTQKILDVFQETETKATFFVLGHVAESHPDLVREIFDRGHEVASHGYQHCFIYKQSPQEFEEDVRHSIRLLESIVHERIVSYRAPYFSVTSKSMWALKVLKKLGFEYDSSIFPVINHRYGIPNAPRLPYMTKEGLIEMPPSTYPLKIANLPIGGGVYFRFLPYWFFHCLLQRLNDRREVIVCYLHPWEIDDGQPYLNRYSPKGLRHYWGLNKSLVKLRHLLRNFRFNSIKEVAESC